MGIFRENPQILATIKLSTKKLSTINISSKVFQNVHFWFHYDEKWTKITIFKKLSDMIINASEWFENISGGRSPIFTALLDGLVPKIDLPTLVK